MTRSVKIITSPNLAQDTEQLEVTSTELELVGVKHTAYCNLLIILYCSIKTGSEIY